MNKSYSEKHELPGMKPFQKGKLTMHILLEQVVVLATAKLNPFSSKLYLQNVFGKGYLTCSQNFSI